MKRIACILLLGVLLLGVVSCGADEDAVALFDYRKVDLGDYIVLPGSAFAAFTVQVSTSYQDTDDNFSDYLRAQLVKYLVPFYDTDSPAEPGDEVQLYYEGSIDGAVPDGFSNVGHAEPDSYVLGSADLFPGLDEALTGVIPGHTGADAPVQYETVLSEAFGSYAGKTLTVKCWMVQRVAGYELPDLTDAFLTGTLGFETDEADVKAAYLAAMREAFREEIDLRIAAQLEEQVLGSLRDAAQFLRVPSGEIAFYRQNYISDIDRYYAVYASFFSDYSAAACAYFGLEEGADWLTHLDSICRQAAEENLVLRAVAQQAGISASEQDLYDMSKELGEAEECGPEEMMRIVGEVYLERRVIYRKTMAYLTDLTTIEYTDAE